MKSARDEQRLFVYGTLRNDSGHEMNRVLARSAQLEGEGTFRGRLYVVDDYPGVVPSRSAGDLVRGQIFLLCDAETTLGRLDEYEECDPAAPEKGLYRREVVDIQRDDGQVVQSWIYLYNRPTSGLRRVSSGDFLEIAEPTDRSF